MVRVAGKQTGKRSRPKSKRSKGSPAKTRAGRAAATAAERRRWTWLMLIVAAAVVLVRLGVNTLDYVPVHFDEA